MYFCARHKKKCAEKQVFLLYGHTSYVKECMYSWTDCNAATRPLYVHQSTLSGSNPSGYSIVVYTFCTSSFSSSLLMSF